MLLPNWEILNLAISSNIHIEIFCTRRVHESRPGVPASPRGETLDAPTFNTAATLLALSPAATRSIARSRKSIE